MFIQEKSSHCLQFNKDFNYCENFSHSTLITFHLLIVILNLVFLNFISKFSGSVMFVVYCLSDRKYRVSSAAPTGGAGTYKGTACNKRALQQRRGGADVSGEWSSEIYSSSQSPGYPWSRNCQPGHRFPLSGIQPFKDQPRF